MEPEDLARQIEQALQGLRRTITEVERLVRTLEQNRLAIGSGNDLERRIDLFLGAARNRN